MNKDIQILLSSAAKHWTKWDAMREAAKLRIYDLINEEYSHLYGKIVLWKGKRYELLSVISKDYLGNCVKAFEQGDNYKITCKAFLLNTSPGGYKQQNKRSNEIREKAKEGRKDSDPPYSFHELMQKNRMVELKFTLGYKFELAPHLPSPIELVLQRKIAQREITQQEKDMLRNAIMQQGAARAAQVVRENQFRADEYYFTLPDDMKDRSSDNVALNNIPEETHLAASTIAKLAAGYGWTGAHNIRRTLYFGTWNKVARLGIDFLIEHTGVSQDEIEAITRVLTRHRLDWSKPNLGNSIAA